MKPYMMRPEVRRYDGGGHLLFGPIQFNWGHGTGAMPKGLRIHLTWPIARSAYFNR